MIPGTGHEFSKLACNHQVKSFRHGASFRMATIPKLNGATHQRWFNPLRLAFGMVLSAGLLYGRLEAIYAPPLPAPSTRLASSRDAPPPLNREDARLFEQALAAGLLRLGREGRIEVAPADLPLRERFARDHPDLLVSAAERPDERIGTWGEPVRQLHRRLYFSASGRYVRQQIEAFNARQTEFTPIMRDGERLFWRDAPTRMQ